MAAIEPLKRSAMPAMGSSPKRSTPFGDIEEPVCSTNGNNTRIPAPAIADHHGACIMPAMVIERMMRYVSNLFGPGHRRHSTR